MKKRVIALWVALLIAAASLIWAPQAATAAGVTGWTYSVSAECTPTQGSPAVEYQPAVYGEAPLISEAVYATEYEFVHKKPDHPQSPRWEAEGWNADDNEHSKGWYATGNTRQGELISEAVYGEPPLISAEVLAQDAVEANDCQIATARWILPNGGTADNVTWPQALATQEALDAILCGETVTIQVDDYPYGTAAEKARTDALGDVLEQGEDYGWAFNWRFETFTSEDCAPAPEQQVEVREASTLDCDARIVTTITEGRSTGEPTFDRPSNTWTQGAWSEWEVIDSKERAATDEECGVIITPEPEPEPKPEPEPEPEPVTPASVQRTVVPELAQTGSASQNVLNGLAAAGCAIILAGAAALAMRKSK